MASDSGSAQVSSSTPGGKGGSGGSLPRSEYPMLPHWVGAMRGGTRAMGGGSMPMSATGGPQARWGATSGSSTTQGNPGQGAGRFMGSSTQSPLMGVGQGTGGGLVPGENSYMNPGGTATVSPVNVAQQIQVRTAANAAALQQSQIAAQAAKVQTEEQYPFVMGDQQGKKTAAQFAAKLQSGAMSQRDYNAAMEMMETNIMRLRLGENTYGANAGPAGAASGAAPGGDPGAI
jgi:hypothetical protein